MKEFDIFFPVFKIDYNIVIFIVNRLRIILLILRKTQNKYQMIFL